MRGQALPFASLFHLRYLTGVPCECMTPIQRAAFFRLPLLARKKDEQQPGCARQFQNWYKALIEYM
jgi:hypothetical protein